MRDLKVRKILHHAVLIYDFHIFITTSSSFHGFITNQFNDLERCAGIAEIKVRIPYKPEFFEAFFNQLQNLHLKLRWSSFIWSHKSLFVCLFVFCLFFVCLFCNCRVPYFILFLFILFFFLKLDTSTVLDNSITKRYWMGRNNVMWAKISPYYNFLCK